MRNTIETQPYTAVAIAVGLGWLASILRVDAFVSPSGTGLIYETGTSRISYGLARNRYAPQMFARLTVDYYGTPTPIPQMASTARAWSPR